MKRWATLLPLVALVGSVAVACGAELQDDSGHADAANGAETVAPSCSWTQLGAAYDTYVAPHLTSACKSCHDLTLPPDVLKAPGPQWLHPADSVATVKALVDLATIDRDAPLQSRFLLKPLAPADGGMLHSGGVLFVKAAPAYDDFVAFLAVAATCDGAWLATDP